MKDFIIAVVIVAILVVAILYIRKAKKSGAKCIGCPDGCSCSGKEKGTSSCDCGCHNK